MAGGFNKLFYSKDIFTQNAEDNRIVTFASAKVLSGSSNLTFDGSNLVLTGNIYLSGDITSSGGGLVTGATNVGGGAGVFSQKSGGELQFNSLAAGTNITINSRDDNTIEISSSGGGGGGGAVNNFNNATNNYIITAVDSDTISGEANLQFDGSALTLVGVISGSSDAVFVGDVTSEGSLNVTGTITGSTLTSTFLTSSYISGAFIYGDGSNITGLTGTPGGSDTQIQFNDGGSFGGDSSLTYNKTTNTLSGEIISGSGIGTFVGGLITEGSVSVSGAVSGASTLSGLGITGTSLELQSGGITNAGAISGTTFGGTTTTLTSLNLQSGGITNGGAIGGVTTISASSALQVVGTTTLGNTLDVTGAISGASTLSGLGITGISLELQSGGITNAGAISGTTLGGTTATITSLALQSGGITNVGSIEGATSISGSGIGTFVGGLITEGDLNVTGTITGSNITATFVTGSNIKADFFAGDGSGLTGLPSAAISSYTQTGNDRIITSVDASSVQGEANLTFDGSTLAVAGAISGSSTLEMVGSVELGSTLGVSGAVSGASTLSGLGITGTSLEIQGGDITNAGTISGSTLTTVFITGSHVSGAVFYGDGSNLTGVTTETGGSDTEVQFNDGGSLGGDSAFTFNKTTNTLSSQIISGSGIGTFVGGLITEGDLNVTGTITGSNITATFVTGSNIRANFFIGDGSGLTGLSSAAISSYTQSGNDRLITSVDASSVQGEANLTFDGSTLAVAGAISGSSTLEVVGGVALGSTLGVSGAVSGASTLSGLGITGTSLEIQGGDITNAGTISGSSLTSAFITGSHVSGAIFYGDGSNLTGITGGSGSPGGSDTQIQFNDGGSFAGESALTYAKGTDTLSGTVITSTFITGSRVSGDFFYGDGSNLTGVGTASAGGTTGSLQFNQSNRVEGLSTLTYTVSSTENRVTLTSETDAILDLQADTANTPGGEDRNVYISLQQDAGTISSLVGHIGEAGYSPDASENYTGSLANSLLVGTTFTGTNSMLQLGTANNVRMTIDSYGRVGINKTNPEAILHVTGTTAVADDYSAIFEDLVQFKKGLAGTGGELVSYETLVITGSSDNEKVTITNDQISGSKGILGAVTASSYVSGTTFYGDGSNLTGIGAASIGGSNTQVQFNDGGTFGGDSTFTFNKTTNTLAGQIISGSGIGTFVGGIVTEGNLNVTGAVSGASTLAGLGITGTSLELQSGGITAAGSIAGATTYSGSSTITAVGAISGSGALSSEGAITTAGGLVLQGSGITSAGAIAGATTVTATSTVSGAAIQGTAGTLTSLNLQSGGITNAGTISGSVLTTTFITGSHISGALFYGDGSNLTGVAGSVAGNNTEVQFNDGGSLGADSGLIFNKTTNLLTAGSLTAGTVTSTGEVSGSGLATFMGGVVAGGTLEVSGATTLGGDMLPKSDVGASIGSPTYRWANVYTGDLHLKNERGDWTIYEEADRLIVMNNLTGIRYKMMLEKIIEK